MRSVELRVRTGDRRCSDLTGQVVSWLEQERFGDGLLSVWVPHATAGLAVIEVGAGSDSDLAVAIDGLLPRDDRWRHRHGSTGHGADHVLPAFVAPSLVVPVLDGRMALGTWQSIVLIDPNVDNPDRTVRLSFLAG